ncbi:BnaA09g16110D [Brassica napus]|uniref:BnaA09g16110D protein n=1 Tax=Brassica napus TaxID=3708 RepID=A0A078IS60_BRANA|nr:BnaA09g16110D [Brassica napus]
MAGNRDLSNLELMPIDMQTTYSKALQESSPQSLGCGSSSCPLRGSSYCL